MKIRCITVDDEPLALNMISSFVRQTPFLELVAEFDNAIDALNYIQSNPVQLLLLDIQMADLTGMELARVLAADASKHKPFIIFTTAYSEFALEGYRVDAIDYVLKPFDYEDFITSISKVRKRIEQGNESADIVSYDNQQFIFIKVDSQVIRLEINSILYIEGLKDYIRIHLVNGAKPMLSLMSLKKLEEKLTKSGFLRIHRSYIISFARVDALLKNSVKIGDKIIPVGATYKDKYEQFVDLWIK
ncbi:LytTR family DNA-binding domain-containing protein [Chryseobacterium sp. NKUCC03_KSP]|uniref:LytR/AlgR family response regulator transcription factor n=1 Tax=Chryseobacterium sp. NKUCC03_KSP TaxID=2842125 RepID=UPI001C5B7CF9|nr:LytTR family DNA-binding domain-containing protein [Chryseobacterium sp. NKUCC03_KSP]MBW3522870.1 LytTR family DNA-binding domain-containing protein [Chryseobacterium sp. NKUCC03_KSP]